MSLSFAVYVGPYLRILNPPKPSTEVRRTCPTVQCEKHKQDIWDQKAKFCPECGSPIEEVTFPAKAGIYFNFDEETDGELQDILRDFDRQEGDVFVVSNLQDGPGDVFDPTQSLYASGEITLELMQREMREFEQKFSRHIQKIKRVFGESAVELTWGVLSDFS